MGYYLNDYQQEVLSIISLIVGYKQLLEDEEEDQIESLKKNEIEEIRIKVDRILEILEKGDTK